MFQNVTETHQNYVEIIILAMLVWSTLNDGKHINWNPAYAKNYMSSQKMPASKC